MYFPIGLPRILNVFNPNSRSIRQLVCNRDKVLFAVLTDDSLLIYLCKPCLCLVLHERSKDSLEDVGMNELVEWKPDSSALMVVTSCGHLLLYKVKFDSEHKGVYEQIDPPQASLRRDSAELFLKESIPCLELSLDQQVSVGGIVTSFCCLRDELMVATSRGHVLRYRWDGNLNRDYSVDLRRVPFCLDQQVSKAVPISDNNTYITVIEYSPLIGGFAVVFNDGRAAFLTAYSLKFDPNQMQGIWAPNVDDATCATVNHKFRLITFGRRNSQCVVYSVDETTGGLIVSHQLVIPGQVYPGTIGGVHCMRWSPDACCLAVAWTSGGISLWSTFGALLMCSLSWDYGVHADISMYNPLTIHSMEWSAEGYQLWMARNLDELEAQSSVIQFSFVKSALTINPCVSHQNNLYLQGEDRLYVNLGAGLSQVFSSMGKTSSTGRDSPLPFTAALADSKQWIVVQIPSAYSATNWPIRYTAINENGDKIVVAGRAGLAHYSISLHKWKLFGNETQEKDMLVTGGLLWWNDFIVAGSYDIPNQKDELRLYPSSTRLSNLHMTSHQLASQVLLLDSLQDKLLVFGADVRIMIFQLSKVASNEPGTPHRVELTCIQAVDLSALCVHPACFVAITLTSLRIEPSRFQTPFKNNFVINISGRLLMVNPQDGDRNTIKTPSVLASCVENVWSPSKFSDAKPHLTEALWLFCGAHGMRVWLPLFPRQGDNAHTFMSKRIMLPFQLKIYPLAILFEDAILLGAENDTILYSSDANSPFSLPYCLLERTSQVYLHHILRQLIRRNLGFHAWEIARCCTSLPYFPHSLELLLHEVLEEEATSKEPIPDAQLPSVIEFIQEFPVYLDTVVRCARKTEIALWPYLFSVAGKPTHLFQKCLSSNLLETAGSYLIILQNLESSAVSRQFATMLLDSTLNSSKWELSKELVRFLKAIDPNDVEVSRVPPLLASSCKIPHTPQVNGNEEDLSLVLGTTQVSRGRSFSTTTTPKIINPDKTAAQSRTSVTEMNPVRKKSVPTSKTDQKDNSKSAEEFFMDVMIERHARRLLSQHRLNDLGCMAANLDFPLVRWLAKERTRAAVVDNCISALCSLHSDFSWPYPVLSSVGNGNLSPVDKDSVFLSDLAESTSLVGDSGYMSFQGNIIGLPKELHQHQHLDERSIMSEADSWFFNDDIDHMPSAMFPWNELPSPQLLDNLAKQVTTKGPAKSDIQLRYLLQLLSDAGCLQWALLVSILLRDAMAVYRLVNSARSSDQTYETVVRLRDDMVSLYHWSSTDCLGYKPFMTVVQGQASVLNKILSSKYRNPTPMPAEFSPNVNGGDFLEKRPTPNEREAKSEENFPSLPADIPEAETYDRSTCVVS